MIRRRRPNQEILFSFDSFLDVVANVVGIILRLILVAWAGARLYKGPPPPPPAPLPVLEETLTLPDPHDPLTDEVEQQRLLLIKIQADLVEHLQQNKQKSQEKETLKGQIVSVAQQRQALEKELAEQRRLADQEQQWAQQQLQELTRQQEQEAQKLSLSLGEIRSRGLKLIQEMEELKKKPSLKQALRYRTPVSKPLQVEELFWECRNGRVTLLDVGTMLKEFNRGVADRGAELRTNGMLRGMTAPVGAFRLSVVLERANGDGSGRTLLSPNGDTYSIGWEAIPIVVERGETLEKALQPDSQFRRIIDNLEPNETAVTFWVYEDSFSLYRKLRDYLHEKDIVVAGRPLQIGSPMAAGRNGSRSRGQ